jgi:hypothetical protein
LTFTSTPTRWGEGGLGAGGGWRCRSPCAKLVHGLLVHRVACLGVDPLLTEGHHSVCARSPFGPAGPVGCWLTAYCPSRFDPTCPPRPALPRPRPPPQGLQGHNKASHYQVLVDENGFSADG